MRQSRGTFGLHSSFLIRWSDKPYLALGVGNVTGNGAGGACGAIFGRQETVSGLYVTLDGGRWWE